MKPWGKDDGKYDGLDDGLEFHMDLPNQDRSIMQIQWEYWAICLDKLRPRVSLVVFHPMTLMGIEQSSELP